ncbi:MAG: GNAT family N-acetyltransferase, partial [Chloroflexota bacterium]|nr:GNAT family N-acetyltransferase [Chloroflexota bacterium]
MYPDATTYLAYIVFPAFWRRGYAWEGCGRILDLLFEDYQVHMVSAEIDTRNTASIHLIESLGFQWVATT